MKMARHWKTEGTLESFEDAVRSYEGLVQRMERVAMDFPSSDDYYAELKEVAADLKERGYAVAELMAGCINQEVINQFEDLVYYVHETADRPSMSKKERLEKIQAIKNIYIGAKPILISRHSRE
jgi:hypothetical protein